MSELLIGTVARGRGWIIERWHEHAAKAAANAGLEATFVLVADPDDDTVTRLRRAEPATVVVPVHEDTHDDVRDWTTERKARMVELRNLLLGEVRRQRPAAFWSIDSDILAHPDALAAMLDLYVGGRYAAVGGACFMRPPTQYRDGRVVGGEREPSYMRQFPLGRWDRHYTPGATIDVDVVMANKVLGPNAYAVDYQVHPRGEDAGWSLAVAASGHRLGWTARVVSKHVMAPKWLDIVDPRCGF